MNTVMETRVGICSLSLRERAGVRAGGRREAPVVRGPSPQPSPARGRGSRTTGRPNDEVAA